MKENEFEKLYLAEDWNQIDDALEHWQCSSHLEPEAVIFLEWVRRSIKKLRGR